MLPSAVENRLRDPLVGYLGRLYVGHKIVMRTHRIRFFLNEFGGIHWVAVYRDRRRADLRQVGGLVAADLLRMCAR